MTEPKFAGGSHGVMGSRQGHLPRVIVSVLRVHWAGYIVQSFKEKLAVWCLRVGTAMKWTPTSARSPKLPQCSELKICISYLRFLEPCK